ncbi:MAG: methionyl-tRNA formyltransferase [Spirillospora sp.]
MTSRIRTVFFGTPDWAVPSLRALLASDIEVAAVVTNPDRPAGRGMELRPSPVKAVALEADVEVLQPDRARDPELAARLRTLGPEVATVVAYGKILPAELLSAPPRGFVNVHFSVLPGYRGAAPVQRALMDGVTETGVSIMVLTEGMDEGPVLAVETTAVSPEDTAGSVGGRLADIGAHLLVRTLPRYAEGALAPTEQDHGSATYAPKVSDDDARIDWALDAAKVRDAVRALNPVPGAWSTFREGRVKLWSVAIRSGAPAVPPGELRAGDELLAGTGGAPVAVLDVQVQGRRRMPGAALARGLRLQPGERFV